MKFQLPLVSIVSLLLPCSLAWPGDQNLPVSSDGFFKVRHRTDYRYGSLLTTSIFEYDSDKNLVGSLFCNGWDRCSRDNTVNTLQHAEVEMIYDHPKVPDLYYWYDEEGTAMSWISQNPQERERRFMAGNLAGFDGVYLLALKTEDMRAFSNWGDSAQTSIAFKVPGSDAVELNDWTGIWYSDGEYRTHRIAVDGRDDEYQFYVACINARTGEYIDLHGHYTNWLGYSYDSQGNQGSYIPTQDIVDLCPF